MKKLQLLLAFLIPFYFQAQIVNIPDANFKARLLQASPYNSIASTETPDQNGAVNSYNSIDTNGDGEIQVSEAQLIKYLYLAPSFGSITSLEGINSFTNLQSLAYSYSQTSLDVSGLTNLKYLQCHSSNLQNLNVTGLINLRRLNCQYNQLSSLNISGLTSLEYLDCSYNQLTSLVVNNLTNLTYLNCQNNQLSSLNTNGLINLTNLSCGYNQLTNLDISDLTNLTYLDCQNNQLSSLDVSNLIGLNCGNNQLTTLFIKNNNFDSDLLNCVFNNNPNLVYICGDDADIESIQNKVNNYGYGATCNINSYCSFTPGGVFYTINGTSKSDGNNNGCDASDSICSNLKFEITNGTVTGSLTGNAFGNYYIPVQAGTHTITPQFENPSYFTAFPPSTTVTFPAATSPFIQDFCITPNGTHHDLEVVIIPLIPAL